MTSALLPLKIGNKAFDFTRPYIMGVLNVPPDSLSDGGLFMQTTAADAQAMRMEEEGADIIDVGGESTRPGAASVSEEEELQRVIPVISELAGRLRIPISIDTRKAAVARQALECGAAMLNDITGFQGDPGLAEVAAAFGVPAVAMHIKGTPQNMQINPHYDDILLEISDYFRLSLDLAARAGLPRANIILDPGIGFGKTFQHNFFLIKNLEYFKSFGLPVMIGVSRKRFLSADGLYDENNRLEQSLVAGCVAAWHGANILRVHDVLAMRKALWTVAMISGA